MNQTFEFKVFIEGPEQLTQEQMVKKLLDAIPGKDTYAMITPLNNDNSSPKDLFRRMYPNGEFGLVHEAVFCLGYSQGYTNGALDGMTNRFMRQDSTGAWEMPPNGSIPKSDQP